MSLFKKFLSVGAATSASRVLGFVREAMIAAILGAGPVADAFYAAFRFPNLFRRLFAEGAFNSAFVPLFAKEVEAEGREAAAKFAGDVFSALASILVVLTIAAIAFMPFLVSTIIAPGFVDTPDKFELTSDLARIMFPYLAAMSLVAMLSGILNSFRSYFLAALAPVLLNVVMITALGASALFDLPARQTGYALATGVVISGALQLGVLLIGIRQVGFSFRPRAPKLTPKVRRLLALAAPAALTGGIVQINIVIGQIIASQQDKAISWLSFADRIYQLPLGVVGIAIGVVLLPELSRALSANDETEVRSLQSKSLEFGLGLTLPAAAALIIIPAQIVAVLYERGAFTPETTQATAAALAAFGVGLPSFVLIKVLQPAFFAREDMRTPMWFSLVSMVVNVVGSLAMFPYIGHVGIAFATSLAGWANAALLAIALARRNDFAVSGATLRRLVMMLVATAMMSAVLLGFEFVAGDVFAGANILVRLPLLAVAIGVSAVVYFGAAFALGGIDRQLLRSSLRRDAKPNRNTP
ncbi:MAG: murein biosynthesis integral membrane protein MurJ [Pseudomonadota bacterium]